MNQKLIETALGALKQYLTTLEKTNTAAKEVGRREDRWVIGKELYVFCLL